MRSRLSVDGSALVIFDWVLGDFSGQRHYGFLKSLLTLSITEFHKFFSVILAAVALSLSPTLIASSEQLCSF